MASEEYVLTCPFASCIYPNPNPVSDAATLSLLHKINESRPLPKRLPVEILLRINDELHKNTLRDQVRSNWQPTLVIVREFSDVGYFGLGQSPLLAVLNSTTKTYSAVNEYDFNDIETYRAYTEQIFCHVSSADLLYRLRCYFPDGTIDSNLDRHKIVWQMWLRHNDTGLLLLFNDFKGAASLRVHSDKDSKLQAYFDKNNPNKEAICASFSRDAVQLLNGLFGEIDGSRRFVFYHPTADADYPTATDADGRFVAVPYVIRYDREQGHNAENRYNNVQFNWQFVKISPTDMSTFRSFRSILQDLKYNIDARKIDRSSSNGTANLTTVISSSLLFYRLLCNYMQGRQHRSIDETFPSTSVWQVQLNHRESGNSIIFMDDRGLFDIRINNEEFSDETMKIVDDLVGWLCSDVCSHPYGVLAGTVA